jgi:nucleoside-diphosphate-sugar epimerase
LSDNKRIYLTGATGFVGRHILSELIAQGYFVHCLISGKNFIDELRHPQVQSIEIDFLGEDFENKIDTIFSKQAADCIIHSAWYTKHEDYLSNSINLQWVKSSKSLIDAFYRHGGKRFIGLGTCIEYDFSCTNNLPISIQTPLKGNTLYAKSKIEVYNYLTKLQEETSTNFVWARLFFIYGPYEKKGRLISYIYEQMATNHRAIPRFGGVVRDYIYVKDLAKQLVSLVQSPYCGAINLGTEGGYKVQDIFEQMGKIMSKRYLVVKNDVLSHNTEYEPHSIMADISEWRSLGHDFKFTPLTEGLRQTIVWMQNNDEAQYGF